MDLSASALLVTAQTTPAAPPNIAKAKNGERFAGIRGAAKKAIAEVIAAVAKNPAAAPNRTKTP